MATEDNWAVEGYDTFENGPDAYYRVKDGLGSEADALIAAAAYLATVEKPQEQLFIVRPDGSKYRFYLA
jgi:hypothetical protein